MEKNIHIIAFDVPYPPNYGGVIDVFYKLKALYQLGAKITLHTFVYGDRGRRNELEQFCVKVYYYPRKKGWTKINLPYIVSSRSDEQLLRNLRKDNAPIIFEALHSCYFLDHEDLKGRFKTVRMHNIEHDYYEHLAQSESNFFKRIYFKFESALLRKFEKKLNVADLVFAISAKDQTHLKDRFGSKVVLLPAFHGNTKINSEVGQGKFCFYHGKLSVSENHQAAMFLVTEVFSRIQTPLVIAGDGMQQALIEIAKKHPHVKLIEGASPSEIDKLIREAHINVLPTFQPTGIKLKLINVLFNGRFLLVNTPMVQETGVEKACIIKDNAIEMCQEIEKLMHTDFTQKEIDERKAVLGEQFDVLKNAEALLSFIN